MVNKYNLTQSHLLEIESYSYIIAHIQYEMSEIRKIKEIDITYGFMLGKLFFKMKDVCAEQSDFISQLNDNETSEFFITEEQLDYIKWTFSQLENQCENINKLCTVELNYFEHCFEIGSMHSHLTKIKMELMLLTEKINSQKT